MLGKNLDVMKERDRIYTAKPSRLHQQDSYVEVAGKDCRLELRCMRLEIYSEPLFANKIALLRCIHNRTRTTSLSAPSKQRSNKYISKREAAISNEEPNPVPHPSELPLLDLKPSQTLRALDNLPNRPSHILHQSLQSVLGSWPSGG